MYKRYYIAILAITIITYVYAINHRYKSSITDILAIFDNEKHDDLIKDIVDLGLTVLIYTDKRNTDIYGNILQDDIYSVYTYRNNSYIQVEDNIHVLGYYFKGMKLVGIDTYNHNDGIYHKVFVNKQILVPDTNYFRFKIRTHT